MSKNRIPFAQPQTRPMQAPHPHTVSVADADDDDNDICPVCDGECTCATNASPKKQSAVLKIRLPAIRIKHQQQQHATTSAVALAANPLVVPKRRGRPPKHLTAARPYKAQPARRKPPPKPTKKPFTAAAAKRRRAAIVSSSSDLSDIDAHDHQPRPAHFPTFVSASALSSASSSDSDSGSGGFETDSSIEAEEETFILAEERARVRRELLGSNSNPPNKRRDSWIIRPRRTSVGDPSDVDMDDSTADEDDDEDEDDDDDDAHTEEDDADVEEEEEDTDGRAPSGCTGMVTGWSDDEESNLDAELFFANLSGSSSSSTSDDDGDHAEPQILDPEVLGEALSQLRDVQDLPFEVMEGWDGQITFTNGLTDGHGQGSFEAEFDARAMQFIVESSTSASEDVDADMDEWDADDDAADDGDTTDEDLVGPDDLPNDKAMTLFNLPFATSMSSVDPSSTTTRRAMVLGRASSEEMDEQEHRANKRLGGPRQGHFELTEEEETKTVIVDDERKDVPSPHPRTRIRPRKFGIDQKPLFLLPRPTSPSPPTTLSITSPEPGSDIPPLAGPIDLDDVLDSAFLDGHASSSEHSATTPTNHDHMRHLTRWDVVSVGAFRRKDVDTSESEYGGVLKSSPLAAMLWQNKLGMPDADSTKKNRRDARKERKLLKKSVGTPVFLGKGKGKSHNGGKVWHHTHAHHANGKSGRSGSSQRTNFFSNGAGGSSPVP